MVVAFYFRLHLAYFPRPVVAIFARPEQAEMYDRQNIGVISDYMSKWNDISIDDKLTVVDTLIESIHVGHGKVKIAWKI